MNFMIEIEGKRIYFNPDDVVDALLAKKITGRILIKSSLYIEDMALNFGVQKEEIADPVPFKIARLAMVYALMMTALENSRMASDGSQDGADAYELKRRVFAEELKQIEAQLSADTFSNGQSSIKMTAPFAVPILRG